MEKLEDIYHYYNELEYQERLREAGKDEQEH
jgi:hypothetical protein